LQNGTLALAKAATDVPSRWLKSYCYQGKLGYWTLVQQQMSCPLRVNLRRCATSALRLVTGRKRTYCFFSAHFTLKS
jgi:hypothetical protein